MKDDVDFRCVRSVQHTLPFHTVADPCVDLGRAQPGEHARAATRVVLDAHRLADMAEPALQTVGELTACGSRFAPGDLGLHLRYLDDELWVILHDGHRTHRSPRLASACDARRADGLRVLDRVVGACGGEWGYGDALTPGGAPGGGTRMWAVLPRAGARAYATAPPCEARSTR